MSKYHLVKDWSMAHLNWEKVYLKSGVVSTEKVCKEIFFNRWMSVHYSPNYGFEYFIIGIEDYQTIDRKHFKELLRLHDTKVGKKFFYKKLIEFGCFENTVEELKDVEKYGEIQYNIF